MKIVVLGSGLLGVTSAYALARRGHQVTVVDRQAQSGAECSFSNGAQLSYTHAEPWATPGVLKKLPKWLVHEDSPLVFRLRADWQMIRWGLMFLRNCTTARAEVNCVNLLRLGQYSKACFADLRADTGIAFDHGTKGILNVFDSKKDFEAAQRQNDFQSKFGGNERILTPQECIALEPALAHCPRDIIGGVHDYQDESGDAHEYCLNLSAYIAERYSVKFSYGVNVRSLRRENGAIVAVETDQGDLTADAYVMALGSYSPLFLRPLGIDIPVYPMKGYSLTLKANEYAPGMSVTDCRHKIVYSRVGDRLRVAGTAEFAGYDDSLNEKRLGPILRTTKQFFPQMDWNQPVEKWACLRPSTPDGPPILGKTPYKNLFLNTGHGTLGWTQAAGSAYLLADVMEGKPPAILLNGLTMERY